MWRVWLPALVTATACYGPTLTPGLPCGTNSVCPDGLVCVPSTFTCELTETPADSIDPDAESDAVSVADAPPDVPGIAACPDNDARLVACYAFEGNANDSSPLGNHATTVQNVGYTTGINGSALVHTSTTDVRVPETPSLDLSTTLTIDVWVRPDALPSMGRALLIDHGGGYALYLENAGIPTCTLTQTNGQSRRVSGTDRLQVDRWTHLACTANGIQSRLYVDGAQVDSGAVTAPINTNGTDGTRLGGNLPDGANPGDDPFRGTIDQLRVWNAVLSASEICEAANCAL